MRFQIATLATIAFALGTPVKAQLVPNVPTLPPVLPITVDPPAVDTPITTQVDIPPVTIDPDVTDIIAPIIPDTVNLPNTPIDLPDVGQVIDLGDNVVTPILDGLGNTIDDVITGQPVTLPSGDQIIPLIDPITKDVVGSIDPVTGAIAKPNGQVVGNVTNQGGQGGSGTGSGSGTGGNSAGGSSGGGSGGTGGSVNNRTSVRNTFISIPQPALGTDAKTTTEAIEEIDERGNVRNRVITTGYSRSVPTISISGGIMGGEGLGLIQLAIPLK